MTSAAPKELKVQKSKECIHSLHLDFSLNNMHDLLLKRKLTDGNITWGFSCHITCSNVSWSLSLKPLYEVVQVGSRSGLWFQDSEKIQELVCHFLLRRMSKKKASGLEVYGKMWCACPTMWAVSSSRADICRVHVSPVLILTEGNKKWEVKTAGERVRWGSLNTQM